MTDILNIAHLKKSFIAKQGLVVNDVSFSLEAGSILSVLGESGSGKTTLIRLIAGLETPDAGVIQIAGKEVSSESVYVAPEHRGIGMVFQDYALFPHLTIAKNIGYGIHKSRDKNARVAELLQLINMSDHATKYPHQLSGGQQQRVALARALAPHPKLLILDEPFSNLDATLKMQLRTEVRDIITKTGVTAIFVTHDTQDAMAIADKIVVLKKGQLLQHGTAQELYESPVNEYVAKLFSNVVSLVKSDLACFGYNTTESTKYAIRLLNLKIATKCDYSCQASLVSTVFLGTHYLHTVKLSNGKTVSITSASAPNQPTITIGFNSADLLSFDQS